jgi:hypothetical protein
LCPASTLKQHSQLKIQTGENECRSGFSRDRLIVAAKSAPKKKPAKSGLYLLLEIYSS